MSDLINPNNLNNLGLGEQAIIDKILSEARTIANSTLEEGGKKADEEIQEAENRAYIITEQNMKETYELRDEIVKRRISVANLEVKKLILKAKKDLIDKAYCQAIDMVLKLDDNDYLSIIKGMLNYANNGDTIFISKNDKDRITVDFVENYAKSKDITLKLSDNYADIIGGIIISDGNCDKNLSLELEFESLRETTETEVSNKLFGEIL